MNQPCVITIILNTNRCADTLECLTSLAKNSYPNQRVLVLDNASSDGSVPAIRSAFPEVQIIELQANLGYAGNNNVGIQAALQQGADWVFVLNEDTLLAPDCLEQLMALARQEARIGIVGPLVYHASEPEVIQSAGGQLGRWWVSSHIGQNERDRGQYCEPRPVEWVSGCAILVRRQVIEQVGMLDERFFYYWEETEWCLRAREKGWLIFCAPGAKLWHKGVQRDYRPGPSVTYYATRNRFLALEKHHAPRVVRLAAWFQAVRTLLSWSLLPRWRSQREHRDALWQGLRDYVQRRWGRRPPS